MRILYLQCLNLGDAVVGTGLVEALAGDGHHIEVLTRPAHKAIYANNPHVKAVHTAMFPMGSNRVFSTRDAWHLLGQIAKLWRRGFDHVIGVSGDFRETAMAWAIARNGSYGPKFAPGNAFAKLGRPGLSILMGKNASLSATECNMYTIVERVSALAGGTKPALSRLYSVDKKAIGNTAQGLTIGIHPSAGLECKLWPVPFWLDLIRTLRQHAAHIVVFAAPNEREPIERDFAEVLHDTCEISTSDVQTFFERLARVKVLVCLDSFSLHAAYAVGTPCIVLGGPTPSELVAPPNASVLAGGSGLVCYPCYNKPTCTGYAQEYACMRRVRVSDVVARLYEMQIIH